MPDAVPPPPDPVPPPPDPTLARRKRWAILLLVVGLPLYLVAAVEIVQLFDRPPLIVEFAIYVGLGILWALPFKRLFRGVGR